MSGPIMTPTGSADGVDWAVVTGFEQDWGGGDMLYPAERIGGLGLPLTPPAYWTGPVPYFGDFETSPTDISAGVGGILVLQFSQPIKQFRTTAQYMWESGMTMAAQNLVGGNTVNVASASWAGRVSGTRTVTYEPGFTILRISPTTIGPGIQWLHYGPTFRNTFFFAELPVIEPVVIPEPDLRVPRGAGRLLSFSWPLMTYPGPTNPQGITIRPMAFPYANHMNQTAVGVAPAGIGPVTRNGIRALRVAAGNGTGYIHGPVAGASKPYQIFPALERMLKANLDGLDEMAVWELRALLSFDNPDGPLAYDNGLVIAPNFHSTVRGTTNAGISLSLADRDKLVLATRTVSGAGAIVEHVLVPPTADFVFEDWHVYALRIVSATHASDALLKVLIDDEPVLTLSWAAGTELPIPFESTQLGFYWAYPILGGNADFTQRAYLAEGGLEFLCGMTEDSLA